MRKYSFLLALVMCLTVAVSPLFACAHTPSSPGTGVGTGGGGNGGGDEEVDDGYIKSTPVTVANFESVSKGGSGTVGEGLLYTLPLGVDAGDRNYIRISIDTSVPVFGRVFCTAVGGTAFNEDFFVPAGKSDFKMILDFYNDYGIKSVDSVAFNHVAGGGTVTVSDVSLAEFPIDLSDMARYRGFGTSEDFQIYLVGDKIKIGCSLESGGGLNFLSYDGAKVCKMSGRTYVGMQGENKSGFLSVTKDKDVNLLNLYDNGRLVQQSYYGIRGGDYTSATYNGSTWPYNPVQGGSQTNGCSKIVDLSVSETEIYVKTRPLDWAHDFSITRSYMENWYSIQKSDSGTEYVRVRNAFTDFSGYVHGESHQELPAFYGIAPLGKAVYYSGSTPFTDDVLTEKGDFGFWADGTKNAVNKIKCTENWISWVNEDNWGLGLYVPDVTSVLAGRFPDNFNDFASYVGDDPSASPVTTYAAPLALYTIKTFTTFSYDYYLTAGEVTATRRLFNGMRAGGVTNSQIVKSGKPTW